MFESVAPETFVPRSRKVLYESLPMSIAAHVALGVTLIVAGTWEVTFPSDSPRLHLSYSIEMEPTPPPPPPAPAAQPQQVAPKPVVKEEVTAPQDIVAPTIIPDEIPTVQPIAAVEGSVGEGGAGEAVVKGWVGGGETQGSGDEVGSPVGVPGGVVGGIGEGPPNTLVVKRHHPLPTSMTPMSMVYPFYPEEARVRSEERRVGKEGRSRWRP